MELFTFLMKYFLKNLFQGQFVSLHHASLLCIILREICTLTHAFILQRQGEGRWGWEVGVNGYAHKYILILPAKRVFLLFGVEASLRGESSLRRFTLGRGKCLVEPPA